MGPEGGRLRQCRLSWAESRSVDNLRELMPNTHSPSNGEWCSGWYDLVQRRGDGISNWIVTNWLGGAGLSGSKASQRGRDNGSDGELHVVWRSNIDLGFFILNDLDVYSGENE